MYKCVKIFPKRSAEKQGQRYFSVIFSVQVMFYFVNVC